MGREKKKKFRSGGGGTVGGAAGCGFVYPELARATGSEQIIYYRSDSTSAKKKHGLNPASSDECTGVVSGLDISDQKVDRSTSTLIVLLSSLESDVARLLSRVNHLLISRERVFSR